MLSQFEVKRSNAKAASTEFDGWLDKALAGKPAQRSNNLSGGQDPREEHLLPLMVVSGAGSDQPAEKIWQGSVGISRVSAWAFN